MRDIILSPVAFRLYRIFQHYLTQSYCMYNVRFDFLYNILSETFVILRKIQRDVIINVKTTLCKVPVIIGRF